MFICCLFVFVPGLRLVSICALSAPGCSGVRARACRHRTSSEEYRLCLLSIGNALVQLTNLLTTVADVMSRSALRDTSNGDLVVPRTRLKLGERTSSAATPLVWNRLPTQHKTESHSSFQVPLGSLLSFICFIFFQIFSGLFDNVIRHRSICMRCTTSNVVTTTIVSGTAYHAVGNHADGMGKVKLLLPNKNYQTNRK